MNLRWLPSFIKFNIDGVIPKLRGMNLASNFQLSTFIRQLVVLLTRALRSEEPARKILLSENIWFILKVLPVDKDATFSLPTFKFNYYSVLLFHMVTCLKIIRFHLVAMPRKCPTNAVFKNIIINRRRNRIYLQWF